jgi:DNA-binding SARP family transcriptional activator
VAATAPITFKFFGELEVCVGDRALDLPRSKKTRALLAYLVLTQRPQRRAHLCRLFWDVTDDPRAGLRWSLTKLRAMFAPEASPIVADRESVGIELEGIEVDLWRLREVDRLPPALRIDALCRIAEDRRGEPLEGLDLPDFDEYQAWCVAEREEVRKRYTAVLAELADAFEAAPERALPFARASVQLAPLDERARVKAIALLLQAGKPDEAQQYYESGLRLERELGRKASVDLHRAMARLPSPPEAELRGADSPTEQPPRAPAEAGRAEAGPCSEPPLVGRASELLALQEQLATSVREHRATVCLLTGESGIGKTRLLVELGASVLAQVFARVPEAALPRPRVLYGASLEVECGRPYGPWRDALGAELEFEAFGQRDPSAEPALEPTAGGAWALELAQRREQLFGGVAACLERMLATAPALLIILDDAQWLDASSAELLHYVCRVHRQRALTVVLSAREEELIDNAPVQRLFRSLRRLTLFGELRLSSLQAADAEALAASAGRLDDAAHIARESGGHPLWILELCRADRGSEALPARVSSLVRDRLTRLPPEAGDVLRWAAVLGSSFELSDLEAMSSSTPEAVIGAIELLARHALLRQESAAAPQRLGFAHDIIRRVVDADLSQPRRALMHRRVAEHLAKNADLDTLLSTRLAHHAALAGDSGLASQACLTAARRSLRIFAADAAYAWARRAARHAEKLPDPLRTQRLIDALQLCLSARRPEDPDAEAARLEQLAERALDMSSLEHARLALHAASYLRFEHGDISRAHDQMLQAELISRASSEHERILGMAEAARCLMMLERDLDQAQALALEATTRSQQAGFEAAAVLNTLGMVRRHQGQLEEAERLLLAAQKLAYVARDRLEEFCAREHLTKLELARGGERRALEHACEMVALGEKLRRGSELPFARALEALIRQQLGEGTTPTLAESLPKQLEESLATLEEVDAMHRHAFVLNRAAALELHRRNWEQASVCARRALVLAEGLEHSSETLLAHLTLVHCAEQTSNGAQRREHLRLLATADCTRAERSVRDAVSAELSRAGSMDLRPEQVQ